MRTLNSARSIAAVFPPPVNCWPNQFFPLPPPLLHCPQIIPPSLHSLSTTPSSQSFHHFSKLIPPPPIQSCKRICRKKGRRAPSLVHFPSFLPILIWPLRRLLFASFLQVMYGRRLFWDNTKPTNHLEWAPPLRVIAAITLFASTLDLMADFLLCSRLAEFLHNFQTDTARHCAYGYFFFTGVSILVYIFEITDVCLTLKNDEEDVYFARLAKSLVLVLEEVPLPALLYFLFTAEPRLSLANPMHIASWIKLITLTWGIIKFAKLRFFWPLLPFNPKHDRRENIRRCFHFNLYRVTMVVVNIFHLLAIFIVVNNLIVSGKGGRPIHVQSSV